jgi:hypothetical protein
MTGLSLTPEGPVTFRYGKWNMAWFGDTSKFGLEGRFFARYQKARSAFQKLSHICHSSTPKTAGFIGRWSDAVYGLTNNEDGNGSNDAHDNIFKFNYLESFWTVKGFRMD